MCEAARFLGQFAISQRALFAARLHEGKLVAVGAGGVSIDEIGSCVFGDIDHCSSHAAVSCNCFGFSLSASKSTIGTISRKSAPRLLPMLASVKPGIACYAI